MSDRPFLVVFALPEESADFLRRLQPATRSGRGVDLVLQAEVAGHAVVVAHTGMGAAAAATGTRRLLAKWTPRLVIGTGFAGGVQPQVRLGDVVCDFRNQPAFALPPGVRAGGIRVSPWVLESAQDKAAFGRETGALAVDMESEAAAAACAEAGVPYVAVRAISDEADTPLPVPTEVCFDLQRQRPRVLALLGFLALHPQRVPAFVRFVRGLGKPRAALAEALPAVLAATGKTLG